MSGSARTRSEATARTGQNLVAFFALPFDPASGRIVGTLVSLSPPDGSGYAEMVLQDASGLEHPIAWRGAARRPYLVPGREYDVRVEHQAAPIPASSIVIRDDKGLVYAAACDGAPGMTVLHNGLPEFDIRMGSPEKTGRSTRNVLEVDDGASTFALAAGEAVQAGDYHLLCVSAGKTGKDAWERGPVSWIIMRDQADDSGDSFASAHTP